MAARLDELIADAAKRGQLTHVSVIGSWTKDGVVFRASYRPATGPTRFGEDADVLQAMIKAMQGKG